jgi:hypothetical protein
MEFSNRLVRGLFVLVQDTGDFFQHARAILVGLRFAQASRHWYFVS